MEKAMLEMLSKWKKKLKLIKCCIHVILSGVINARSIYKNCQSVRFEKA